MENKLTHYGVNLRYIMFVRATPVLLRGSATKHVISLVDLGHLELECSNWQSKRVPGYPGVAGICLCQEAI